MAVRKWQSLTVIAVAAGSLMSVVIPAQAFDRAHCNGLFGGANVARADTFSMNAGRVDFGDDLHVGGAPRGTAVVCWSIDGRMALTGKVYADSIGDNVMAIVSVRFRRNGVWSAEIVQSVFGNFAASKTMSIVSDVGNRVDRVRVRLLNGNVTALGDGPDTLLATRNFQR
jgi:hypothetical protein